MDLQIINVTEKDSITTIHLDQMDNGLINMRAISEMLDDVSLLFLEAQRHVLAGALISTSFIPKK
jgi:hypothetical protein